MGEARAAEGAKQHESQDRTADAGLLSCIGQATTACRVYAEESPGCGQNQLVRVVRNLLEKMAVSQ